MIDKKGRAIKDGDLLKIYHFTGARRKRHYMYKLVKTIDGVQYAYDCMELILCGELEGHRCLLKFCKPELTEVING